MTDFEKTYQNYNPRAAALAEARALLTEAAKAAMADGTLPEAELPAFIVEIPADTKNGDIASNLAMAGARTWRKAPKMIADALLAHLPSIEHSVFAKVEVAGPGFINLFLAPSFWASVVLGACSNKEYGRTNHGKGAKYNVEFVSVRLFKTGTSFTAIATVYCRIQIAFPNSCTEKLKCLFFVFLNVFSNQVFITQLTHGNSVT